MLKFSARNLLIFLALLGLVLFAAINAMKAKHIRAVPVASIDKPAAKPDFNTMYTAGAAPERRAFNAAEEAYSVALWRVHDQVKTSSVQLSFTGE